MIKILYEDNHVLVVEKPANIVVEDFFVLLKSDIKKRYNKPGNVYLGLVHRLDRNVGGVMVFAKTSKCASRLSKQMRERTIKKYYLALVHGRLKNKQGVLEHFLVKDKEKNKVEVKEQSVKDSKKANLSYRVIENRKNSSLVEIDLQTGRPHQIRAQFGFIGHPVYGDKKYGSDTRLEALCLWAFKLEFEHPVTKERLSFTSKPLFAL